MHVFIVNQYAIPPSQAGITRHFMLARELVRRGHRVTIVASSFDHVTRRETRLERDADFAVECIDDVTFLWLRTPEYRGNSLARIWNMVVFAWSVWRRVGADELGAPDVILGSSPHLFGAFAAERVARKLGVPFVLEVRDLWPRSLIDLGGYSERHPVVVALARIERYLYRRAAHVVTLLPRSADHIVDRGGAAERISWLPNGVDLRANANVDAGPARPTVPGSAAGEAFTVMYAGTHGLANALDSVLDAAAILQRVEDATKIRFRFVGDGPQKPRLKERAAAEALRNVVFEEPVPKVAVPATLREADAFVVTLRDIALYEHGTSLNKVYDYMAAGRPIVLGTRDPENPVTLAGAGIAVPPEDARAMATAIHELATMPRETRAAMGEGARRFVSEHHDLVALGRALESVLQDAVSRTTS